MSCNTLRKVDPGAGVLFRLEVTSLFFLGHSLMLHLKPVSESINLFYICCSNVFLFFFFKVHSFIIAINSLNDVQLCEICNYTRYLYILITFMQRSLTKVYCRLPSKRVVCLPTEFWSVKMRLFLIIIFCIQSYIFAFHNSESSFRSP